jgi:hypothetical protein
MGLRLTFSSSETGSYEGDDCENERGKFGGGLRVRLVAALIT